MSRSRHPLPFAFAQQARVLLQDDGQALTLLLSEQAQAQGLGEVLRVHGHELSAERTEILSDETFEQLLGQAYSQQDAAQSDAAQIVSEVQSEADLSQLMQALPAVEDLLEAADDAPIIRMLNALLTQASRDGASDIHIEPYERHSSVRFRVDGRLREVVQPHRALHAALISRLKIMASLDIAEKRLPQDGRISLRLGARAVDVRVSTLPSAHGERAVLRLLEKSGKQVRLDGVGMQGPLLAQYRKLITQPHGILLVTGPTGSGKTTSLYATLGELDSAKTNILTVEDPIEYELPGIGQTQVNPKIDLSFAKALRAILRQDPDVIMIGEIRDFETAQIANDAVSAVTRLVDMGIEPFLLSSSLLGVLAQRLVRKTCVHCQGKGCEACGQTGYSGRTGIFELLVIDEPIQALIHQRSSEAAVAQAAQAAGMVSMRQDGERLVAQGVTDLAELMRVTRE
jgi:general secretion pathway protein E